MKHSSIFALTLALALGAAPALAQEFKAGDIVIEKPWARATPKGAEVGGAYMTIENKGATPDRLTGGSADFATVEIHEMKSENGVMEMREVTGGLNIPAHGSVGLVARRLPHHVHPSRPSPDQGRHRQGDAQFRTRRPCRRRVQGDGRRGRGDGRRHEGRDHGRHEDVTRSCRSALTALARDRSRALPLRPFPGRDADVRLERLSLALCAGAAQARAFAGRPAPGARRQRRRARDRDCVARARIGLDGRRLERRRRSGSDRRRPLRHRVRPCVGSRISFWRPRSSPSSSSVQRDRWAPTAVASGALLASLGLVGHAAMQTGAEGVLHRGNHAVHLLAAGAWIGGLVPFVDVSRRLRAKRHPAGGCHGDDAVFLLRPIHRRGDRSHRRRQHRADLRSSADPAGHALPRASGSRKSSIVAMMILARPLQSLCSRAATQAGRAGARGPARDQHGGGRARRGRDRPRQRVRPARPGVARRPGGPPDRYFSDLAGQAILAQPRR